MKYTIELTDNQKKQMDLLCELAHRYIGFNPKLEMIETTNVEDTSEYQIGHKTGYDIAQTNAQATKEEWGKAEYKRGSEDARRTIWCLLTSPNSIFDVFPEFCRISDIVIMMEIQEIDARIKAYEEKKKADEIKVGDVVKFNEKCHSYDHVKSREFLVLHIFDNGLVTLLYDNGDTGAAEISLLDKTDKHIDEVEQLLSKLQAS